MKQTNYGLSVVEEDTLDLVSQRIREKGEGYGKENGGRRNNACGHELIAIRKKKAGKDQHDHSSKDHSASLSAD